MASTNRFRNFVDTTHNAVAITGVKAISFDRGVGMISDSADADAFITHRTVGIQDPVFTVTTMDATALLASGAGTRGIFAFKWLESYSQAKTALSGTLSFATNNLTIMSGSSMSGSHQQLGQQELTFATCSADGVTNPVTVTIL